MSSTITAPTPAGVDTSGARTAVAAAGLVGALASAGYISGVIFMSGASPADAQRAPITIAECMVAGLAFIALSVSLVGLAGVTRLPRWALGVAAAAVAFLAIQAWSYGTVVADLAGQIPAEDFERLGAQPTLLLQLLYLPLGLFGLVGFVSLAVVGWRRRAMSRGACVVLILAGLASLLGPFPPAGLLAGIGLAWAARSAR